MFYCKAMFIFGTYILLTLCLLVLSADNLCKQFGSRSGSKLLTLWWYSEFFEKIKLEKKSEDEKKKNILLLFYSLLSSKPSRPILDGNLKY